MHNGDGIAKTKPPAEGGTMGRAHRLMPQQRTHRATVVHGISAGSYYKWRRRLYQMTAGDGPQFIEVTPHQPARDPAAVIHIRDTEVEILPNLPF